MGRRQAPIDTLENTQKTPEEQIRGLLDWTDRVVHQASQAKQLKDTQAESLGEIEHNWISSTICDADNAARDLTKLVEPYRLDMLKHKGKMKAANRKRWSLGDSQLAREKLSELTQSQSRLNRVCNHLQGVRNLPKTPIQGCDGETVAEPPIEIFEFLPSFPCEASSFESHSTTIVAELDTSPVVRIGSPVSLPKIIVTRPPDEITLDHVEISDEEQPSQESHEIDDALYWDETRNSIRMQQSESLSDIVAKMELTRIK
ncbi:hypothetical protein PENDEC_c008G02007 [Penicillium decumbens]|uniref:Uncharacterized protein n=1 Tax=Penicillium decumbens TaxID=69771 RepID=A0A1V6PF69_PENDC|nr:hypothetical protein PENDEC_c008G02007 [Penicillium decumbens]